MFKCKVCLEKDARIADLHKQIEFLKQQLAPSPVLPTINMEAARMMDGGLEIPPTEQELKVLAQETEERNRLLSGNYE